MRSRLGKTELPVHLFGNESLKDGTRGTRDTSQLERVQDSSADGDLESRS